MTKILMAMTSGDHVWRWKKSLQYSTDLGFTAEWPDRSRSSVKDIKPHLELEKLDSK